MSPTNHIFLKAFKSELQGIWLGFTDQNSQSLEIEDTINLTLLIKWYSYSYYKNALFNWTKNACKKILIFVFYKKFQKWIQSKHVDSANKSTTDTIKTAPKQAIQKDRSSWWFNW